MRRLFTSIVLFLAAAAAVAQSGEKPAEILFFTKSQRYEHSVIKRDGGKSSFAENVLSELSAKHNWKITTTKDGGVFSPETIAKYDAIMFYTSGDLLAATSKDGSAPMTATGKQALLDAVKDGKPFIAVHNALATFDKDKQNADPFCEMLGAVSLGHGAQQKARNICVDAKFPGCVELNDGIEMLEEWYSIRVFDPKLHVILVQESKGMDGHLYLRPPYPATWARMHGKGRVFVTSMGHREDVWTNPAFQSVLQGGINWALGRIDADLTPNLEQAAPKYAELPPPASKK